MTDEITELKRKVAELEARQQVTHPPSKPIPGDVPAIKRLVALIVLAIIGMATFFNNAPSRTTPGVSTAADVVASQQSSAEELRAEQRDAFNTAALAQVYLAQVYRYCDHAAEVEERGNGDLGYFGRIAFKGRCQRKLFGLDGGEAPEPAGPNWGLLNLQD